MASAAEPLRLHAVAPYDAEAARRDRQHKADQRITALERILDEAIQLLATTARIAAGQQCDPLTILAIAELINTYEPEPIISSQRLLELLGGP